MTVGLPTLLHALGQATRVVPLLRFARAAEHPAEAQLAKLLELLGRNANTEYGRAHDFASIRSAADFARRVPIVTPTELQPFVDRMMRGERHVLTADAPVYYTRTSGSTGVQKHVPITPSYRRDFQKTVHVSLGHLARKFPAAFFGRILYFVGSRRFDVAADGNDIGTMSGFNFAALPLLLRKIYAWPHELFEIADLRSRSYVALYLALIGDVSMIAGIFPAPIVYLLRDLDARGDELARDLRRGELSSSLDLTPPQRAFFSALAKPRPDVAARVERALRAPDGARVSTALPMLRLVYCWTTSTAELYLPELKRRLGPDIAVRDAIYSATEGWCTITMGEEESGGPLALESGYYEFIPEAAYTAGSRDVVPIDQLRDGERYVIVMTTAAGMYRCDLGDVIEVCGKYRKTPRVRFVRRSAASSSFIGEKIDEVHVTKAVSSALAQAALEATWFTLVATPGDPPGYTLHLELPATTPSLDSAARAALARSVDDALRASAFDYDKFRSIDYLAPIALRIAPPGTYESYRQGRLRGGAAEAQLKTVHLIPDPSALPAALRGE
jgi:hypothetical protein